MDVLGDDVSMDDAFKAADNVLRNAVGGIAEIINFPGLVNVDFEDVRTVMGEMGMAMMGSANAAGVTGAHCRRARRFLALRKVSIFRAPRAFWSTLPPPAAQDEGSQRR